MRLKTLCKLKSAGHCISAKRLTSILRHIAEAFPPARQGTILNSHREIGIAINTSKVLNDALEFTRGYIISLIGYIIYAYNVAYDPMY